MNQTAIQPAKPGTALRRGAAEDLLRSRLFSQRYRAGEVDDGLLARIAHERRQADPQADALHRLYRLQVEAHGGSYAVWLSARERKLNGRRLGRKGLADAFGDSLLTDVVLGVGSPAYVVHSTKHGVPVLYVRARFGVDFRRLTLTLAARAADRGLSLVVEDATKVAQTLIEQGIR